MTDPNRERWEREAEESAYRQFPEDSRYEERDRYRMIDGFAAGYLAACEQFAPRWVRYPQEELPLHRQGWRSKQGRVIDGQEWSLMYPPPPASPGGDDE